MIYKAALVERGGGDGVALRLVHGDALAGEGALVHGAVALEHDAVYRDVLARADDEDVALFDLVHADGDLLAAAHDGGGLGCELHEALEGVRGLALAAGLEHLAYGDEGKYHGRGLEVELSVHDVHLVHRVAVSSHLKERVGAPDEGGAGAEGDEGVHVRRAVREAPEAGDEELLVDDHDYNSQIELDERLGHVVRGQEIRQRPAPHHGAHGEIHEHYEEADGRDQAALEHRGLVVLKGGFGLGHGARGALFLGARALFARAVARVHDGLDYVRAGGRALNAHGVRQQADRAARDARDGVHGLLDSGTACRAAHTCYSILLHTIPFPP